MRDNQNVDPKIEFLVPNKQGVMDVLLHDIGFGLGGRVCPIGYLAQSLENEDALALAFADLP